MGDTHQQIYGWRFAINSLEKADYKTYCLSTSFRFNQDIANLAVEVLKWKDYLDVHKPFPIIGKGITRDKKKKAVIARTNLGLLLKAIEYVTEKKNIKKIYFEGNISSYTYADEGASLYDVLNLYNGKLRLIKDKLILEMKDIEELEEYIKKTDDVQLAMMVEIVKEYGNEIPGIIKAIKEKHVENDEKEKAEMIFSTVHRCKGTEYDSIQLVNDFITEEKLEQLTEDLEENDPKISKLNEEINLLYVAVTRTRNNIHIPETLIPLDIKPSAQIHIMKVKTEEDTEEEERKRNKDSSNHLSEYLGRSEKKSYSLEEVRVKHKDAYKPWSKEQDEELTKRYCEGINIKDLAKHFGRTKGAIESRIKKLELADD